MKRSAIVMSLLVILFTAPGLIAYIVYTHPQWMRGRTNHGQLLQPPPLLTHAFQEGKWQLMYWAPNGCEQSCFQRMDELAKLRLALGRRLYYVNLVLATPATLTPVSQDLQANLEFLDGQWLQLNAEDTHVLSKDAAIYLINPQRYVILAYSQQQAVKDIFQDLQKMVHDR